MRPPTLRERMLGIFHDLTPEEEADMAFYHQTIKESPMSDTSNPRAVIGSNTPDAIDYAKLESDRLQGEYAELANTVEDLVERGSAITEIANEEDKSRVMDLIKSIRDAKARVEAFQKLEKQPYLRRGQGVDQYFFGLWDRLMKREKKNRDGIADILGRLLTDYDVRKLAEENERRRKIAEEAARVEAARLAEQQRLEKIAEEARLKAERARTEATTKAKEAEARKAEEAASAARVNATVATTQAEQAHVDTLARPADIMRTRTDSGTLGTMATETYAEIENPADLDFALLWPFVPFEAKQKALNAWARSTDYRVTMPGAKVGRRPKSRVR